MFCSCLNSCISRAIIAFVCLFGVVLFQRVFESNFVGRRSVVKERFSKKYRHPTLDSKLTLKRLNAVSHKFVFFFTGFLYIFQKQVLNVFRELWSRKLDV